MSFKQLLKEIESSKEYKQFNKQYPDSFLSSAFFIVNKNFEIEMRQVDFFITSENKIMSFILDQTDCLQQKLGELYNKDAKITKKENEIDPKEVSIEFKELQKSIKEKIKYLDDLNKVIVVLHKKDKKTIWSLTCMLTSLKITSLSIDAKSGKLLEEKSANISDYIKVDKG
ncbi:hypothetical protein J4465_02050 [Candidatus Pacearchaeota archaeon]|nr:hypothetical protein [Candidatus Pacearchaeota archaeon]